MWEVEFTDQSIQELHKLDRTVAQRILRKLRWLSENYSSIEPERLSGQLANLFKLRVGDYRLLYTTSNEERKLIVHMVGHRSEIYKR
ncbi:MAG: type II toxin-antitoxin system RelE/ParE family toxin [Candidatus Kapaibacterium sp.]